MKYVLEAALAFCLGCLLASAYLQERTISKLKQDITKLQQECVELHKHDIETLQLIKTIDNNQTSLWKLHIKHNHQ